MKITLWKRDPETVAVPATFPAWDREREALRKAREELHKALEPQQGTETKMRNSAIAIARERAEALVEKHARLGRPLSDEDAVAQVFSMDGALYEQYRVETALPAGARPVQTSDYGDDDAA